MWPVVLPVLGLESPLFYLFPYEVFVALFYFSWHLKQSANQNDNVSKLLGASIEEIEEGLENVLLNIGEGIGDVVDELDKQMECKEQGEECNGAPACCDSLVCHRDIQWNPFTVTDLKCQFLNVF